MFSSLVHSVRWIVIQDLTACGSIGRLQLRELTSGDISLNNL